MSGSSCSGKRRMLKEPTMAGWAPASNGSTCRVTLGSLDASISRSSWPRMTSRPPTGRRRAASSTTAHSRGGCSRGGTIWRGLRSRTPRPPPPPGAPKRAPPPPPPPAHLLAGVLQVRPLHHRPHVVVGLQQAGHELALVGPDQDGGRLQVHVGPEPRRQHVAVVLPPAGRVGLPGQGEEVGHLLGVGDLVEAQQVDDIALLEADLAVLEAVDLPLRGPDGLGRLLAGQLHLRPPPPQPVADRHALDGRPAPTLGPALGHTAPPVTELPHSLLP